MRGQLTSELTHESALQETLAHLSLKSHSIWEMMWHHIFLFYLLPFFRMAIMLFNTNQIALSIKLYMITQRRNSGERRLIALCIIGYCI